MLTCSKPALLLVVMSIAGCVSEPHPGELTWQQNCQVCHGVGLAGSPKFGDKKAWTKRIARGTESLYGHAIEGWGDMPAKGGNPALSEQEVKHAIDYMVANSR